MRPGKHGSVWHGGCLGADSILKGIRARRPCDVARPGWRAHARAALRSHGRGVGPGATEPHYVRVYMGQLRHKLEPDPTEPRYLITETGVGYRLKVD